MRALLLVLLVACGNSHGKTCDDVVPGVVDRVVRNGVMKSAGAAEGGAPDKLKREAEKMAADMDTSGVKKNLIKVCHDDAWPADTLTCLAGASSARDFDTCMKPLSADKRDHANTAVNSGLEQTAPKASPQCKHYADLEIQCGKAKEDARPVILSYCEKARGGDPGSTYKLIAAESECAQTAADCDSYKACGTR